jgi:hypothetical protein
MTAFLFAAGICKQHASREVAIFRVGADVLEADIAQLPGIDAVRDARARVHRIDDFPDGQAIGDAAHVAYAGSVILRFAISRPVVGLRTAVAT